MDIIIRQSLNSSTDVVHKINKLFDWGTLFQSKITV